LQIRRPFIPVVGGAVQGQMTLQDANEDKKKKQLRAAVIIGDPVQTAAMFVASELASLSTAK
jgi:hypothetical protein